MAITRAERLAGGLLGLLVGDALGVPYEFQAASKLPPLEQIDFTPPLGFSRSHRGVPIGTYSDDGAQALCLLASLQACGGYNAHDLASRIAAWLTEGEYAVDREVFDVGITTRQAVAEFRRGIPAESCGPTGKRDNGNGALMRVLPLVLWHRRGETELIELAMAQSRVTHGHVRSQICCAMYCLWARAILNEQPQPWEIATHQLAQWCQQHPSHSREFETHVQAIGLSRGTGTGYVVDTLHSTRWACSQGDFATIVRSAVALGDDTDTTAAVAGGIAGLMVGAGGIPKQWRMALRGTEWWQPLMVRLLQDD